MLSTKPNVTQNPTRIVDHWFKKENIIVIQTHKIFNAIDHNTVIYPVEHKTC